MVLGQMVHDKISIHPHGGTRPLLVCRPNPKATEQTKSKHHRTHHKALDPENMRVSTAVVYDVFFPIVSVALADRVNSSPP